MSDVHPRTPYDVPITIADHAAAAAVEAMNASLAEHGCTVISAVVALRIDGGPAEEFDSSVTSIQGVDDPDGRVTVAALLAWADRVASQIGLPLTFASIKGGPTS